MYNTDSNILRQVCHLMKQITKKYPLSDEDIYKVVDASSILLKLAKQIETSNGAHNGG